LLGIRSCGARIRGPGSCSRTRKLTRRGSTRYPRHPRATNARGAGAVSPAEKLGTFSRGVRLALTQADIKERQMAGTMDKIKGSVKDAVGRATGNTRMQAEGKTDKAKGHARDMAERE
jgi:uncharacterized protein YjbJ (UPF0337 family)